MESRQMTANQKALPRTREQNVCKQTHSDRWNASRKQPVSFKSIVATTSSTVRVYNTHTWDPRRLKPNKHLLVDKLHLIYQWADTKMAEIANIKYTMGIRKLKGQVA